MLNKEMQKTDFVRLYLWHLFDNSVRMLVVEHAEDEVADSSVMRYEPRDLGGRVNCF